jgi:DNA-binding MarR family transcriptional regulator
MPEGEFDLANFLPYLLNMAAEEASTGFREIYKQRHGMLRTEWRVVFHLGYYGALTAKNICERARLHKTKVSRAVAALEQGRLVVRRTSPDDRRVEFLNLTRNGMSVYRELSRAAADYDRSLSLALSPEEATILRRVLRKIAAL